MIRYVGADNGSRSWGNIIAWFCCRLFRLFLSLSLSCARVFVCVVVRARVHARASLIFWPFPSLSRPSYVHKCLSQWVPLTNILSLWNSPTPDHYLRIAGGFRCREISWSNQQTKSWLTHACHFSVKSRSILEEISGVRAQNVLNLTRYIWRWHHDITFRCCQRTLNTSIFASISSWMKNLIACTKICTTQENHDGILG